MAINAEQQNLINDLKAPIKSFRIFALEEAIKSGSSKEVLDVLKQLKIEEDDGECQVLIGYAISAVEGRLSGADKKPGKKIKEQQEFLDQWEKADDAAKMQILSQLPARLPAAIKPLGPDLLSHEESTVISAKIIRVFCRGWPEERFSMISDLLKSQSLSLRLASLRTIVHLKPKTIVKDLPELLASEDPQIKALAIRGLVKIDKEEALKHLQALLLSSNLSDRLAGIQNCPFLPFEMVKPVLLKYFAAENHPELLIRAGWILEMNPDMKVPFKLYEIAERSPSKKAELVKKILNETVKLLEKSGILGDQFPVYMKKLQAWVNKRNALRFVKKVIPRLELETIPAEIDQLIRNKIKQKIFSLAFQEALSWPVSNTVRGRLSAYVKSAEEKQSENKSLVNEESLTAKEPEAELVSKESSSEESSKELEKETGPLKPSLKGSREDIVATLTSLDNKKAISIITDIKHLINDRNADNGVRASALDTLARLKLRGCEDSAEKLVTGNNIPVATAALEYLGAVEPERVFPYLGQCLKVPDIRMKSAALGILKNFDFNQAVSSLNAMLKSNDPAQQKMAIECMDQFDFSLIREDLTKYLEKCDNEELLEAGLCHYAANAAVENVYALYRIEKAQTGKLGEYAEQVRKSCIETLNNSELETDQNFAEKFSEEFLEQKWQQEQQKKKESRPAYAYREKTYDNKPNSKEQLAAIFELLKNFFSSKAIYIVLIILVLLALGFYTLFMPGKGVDTKAGMGRAIMASKYVREGKINKIVGTAVVFESVQEEEFIFHPVNDGYRMPKTGTKLRVTLVPYRKTPDGGYLARVRAMRKIDEFSVDETDKNQ